LGEHHVAAHPGLLQWSDFTEDAQAFDISLGLRVKLSFIF